MNFLGLGVETEFPSFGAIVCCCRLSLPIPLGTTWQMNSQKYSVISTQGLPRAVSVFCTSQSGIGVCLEVENHTRLGKKIMASPLPNEIDLENAPSVTALKEKVKQRIQRAMWLRAAILGANDGLLSTASLMLGIGAASSDKEAMIISGIAGGLAGACSMAVGEFVSVSTQRDIEKTMVEKCVAHVKLQGKLGVEAHSTPSTVEESGLEATSAKPAIPTAPSKLPPAGDQNSPTRVLSPSRSSTMNYIASEARLTTLQDDEIEVDALPNPYKAAAASALSFLCGAFIPIVSTMAISSSKIRFIIIAVVTTISLVAFGGIGAFLGGSPVRVSAMRAVFGGWISMSISYGLLKAFDGADQ